MGIRAGDLLRPDYLRTRLEESLPGRNRMLADFDRPEVDLESLLEKCAQWRDAIGERIIDTLPLVREAVTQGQRVLLEGQLGVMRDLDWGIYPYVTSSNPAVGAASCGAGIPPTAIDGVLGVVKAYSTSVGGGPFPCELLDDDGQKLRDIGHEYGATTGRPRRCGWFDGVAIKHASWLNGFTELAVTKMDILDHFDEIKLCTGYRLNGEIVTDMPETQDLYDVEPIYEVWPGWDAPTRVARTWNELPKNARNYLHRIAEIANVPIRYVSVGPERAELVVLDTYGVEGVE
jgi:adenylosuccinate synthase